MNKYVFQDGEWTHTFSFYKYNTIRISMTKLDNLEWYDWHVWYDDNGKCNWSHSFNGRQMSQAAIDYGNKLIRLKTFL